MGAVDPAFSEGGELSHFRTTGSLPTSMLDEFEAFDPRLNDLRWVWGRRGNGCQNLDGDSQTAF